MPLKLFNTLTRKKEEFKPLSEKQVTFYSCGPTVYGFAHIGNFRAFIVADLLKRYLRYKGFKVKHVMNITDVDDKTIRDSQKEGVSLKEFTRRYEKAFFEDLKTLNIEKADVNPRATENIEGMVELVKILLKKGVAYKGDDGCIYFNIRKFKDYGRLSGVKLKGLKAGARVSQDEYEKENASDFALWKAWDENDGEVMWDTPIGKGRPGWHIECSVMSSKNLGQPLDIHSGGVDLIFPHHENEIAQSEAAYGKKFVNYWVHNEHLLVEGKKMSKSLGNFFTLRGILEKKVEPMAIRYALLSKHYRQKLNFTFKGLESAANSVKRLREFMLHMKHASGGKRSPSIKKHIEEVKQGFESALDDDMDISGALRAIFQFIRKINKLKPSRHDAFLIFEAMKRFDSVLGIMGKVEEKDELEPELQEMIKQRERARKEGDFEKADAIRDALEAKGVLLDDTEDGTIWKRK